MNTPMTTQRLAECGALAAAHRQCFAPATADAIDELVAEVDRLQTVDHRCPSDHWPGRRHQHCQYWLGHEGDHGNRFYAWSDETRYPPPTSGDEEQP